MEKSFNAAEAEARISAKWDKANAFAAGANASREETFTIMIPPPNVTGALHVGHAFNNTLQDILVRWHRMRGFDTLWQPGQDHAGIATQLQVEKKLMADEGKRRTDLTRDEFLNRVWDWKTESAFTIIDQLKRLGCSLDWDRNAFTMAGAPGDQRRGHENSANFHDAVIKVFVDMYDKGYIYRGKRLVNWDTHFETAISDLEVENTEVDGHMWHFKYPLAGGATYDYVEKDEDGNVTLREPRNYISIATTRPETMLGDGAVAVHPSDERYASLVGTLCEIPVGPKEHRRLIPIITDEYPDMDFGSGAVKITGAHDFNDYEVAKRGNIPMYRLMDTRGHMRNDGAPYAEAATRAQAIANGADWTGAEVDTLNLIPDELRGLDRFDARKLVVEQINAEGLSLTHLVTRKDKETGEEITETVPYVESKKIMQPFGDRSKVVIEPMLTDQWFVDTDKIVGPALEAVRNGDVKIIPESGEKVFFHWLDNIEPWCISRQLWWGHQVPVWYGPESYLTSGIEFCGASEEEVANLAARHYRAELGVEVHIEFPEEGFFNAIDVDPMHEGAERDDSAPLRLDDDGTYTARLRRDPDVLDTWFSSGLWPMGTLGWPNWDESTSKYFPTDVLITGQDILFFWVARMMMMSQAVVQENPFHTVYLHQLVRDEKGKKMSKTTGNVIDPLEIIDEFGTDALRFTNASMAAIGGVLKLSVDKIKGYRNFGTKLWNAARFAEMNECRPVPGFDPAAVNQTVNRWIIGEIARARVAHDEALTAYRFNDAANMLYATTWGKVCDWYLEFAKPLFFSGDEVVIEETRATMAWVIDQCLILLHPVMPFITEELWGEIATREKLLVHTDWPEYGLELVDADADREMNWVISLIDEIRSVRSQMRVPAGLKVPLLQAELDDRGQGAWDRNEAMILRIARVVGVERVDALPKGVVTVAVAGGVFGLPIAEMIDVDAEKDRLEKVLGKLAKELGGLRGRLNNPKFAASAPAEVVAETKENLAAREEEEGKIKAALARLAEVG